MFKNGPIEGLVIKPLKLFRDERGWLTEIFRKDELPAELMPVMSHISMTKPHQTRGPHEHAEQFDYFAFSGPGKFLFMTWDNRKESPTFLNRRHMVVGSENRCVVIVPPGVVHAYANIGDEEGLIYNCPNRLYAGTGKKDAVDEIRHEHDASSKFVVDLKALIMEK